jgi:2',3'-cyclic-nucleotide 2'-phosphodiesterase/3'-nucleotidase/5'-nucleotidase
MKIKTNIMQKKFYSIGLLVLGLIFSAQINAQDVRLERLGGYSSGVFDEGAAEIVSYDKGGEKLYFINAEAGTVGVLDISDASNPVLEATINVASDVPNTGGLNAVAAGPNFFAVAVEHDDKQANGYIAFYQLDGTFITSVDAGALPDNIQVSPDGKYVVSANEGEPNDDYDNDPEGSVTIVAIPTDVTTLSNSDATTLGFTQFNGQTFTDGTRIFGPNATVSQDLEPEYVAFSSNSEKAYIVCQENNTVITVDVVNKSVEGITGLGFKDHSIAGNGFDASDKSNAINITTQPTKGMYQPDAIVSYTIDGVDYLFTANEGDSRDYDGYSEEVRVDDLTLDSSVFTDAQTLQLKENLGRLKTTTANGDADNDGDFEEIYSYGARSFSIWKASDISQVYDSGDDLGQQLLIADSDNFNSTNDENDTWKKRSDDKGCEPEAIDVGTINDKHYAFIGLERMGGVMVYDVTDVTDVSFVTYENNRNFDVAADSVKNGEFAAGDLAPECVIFIPAADHSSGKNLLVVSNEVSGSISIYDVVSNLTTGVENKQIEELRVFPNPVSGYEIQTSLVDDYIVLNTLGRQVASFRNTQFISTAQLAKGMYFLVAVKANKQASFIVVK